MTGTILISVYVFVLAMFVGSTEERGVVAVFTNWQVMVGLLLLPTVIYGVMLIRCNPAKSCPPTITPSLSTVPWLMPSIPAGCSTTGGSAARRTWTSTRTDTPTSP